MEAEVKSREREESRSQQWQQSSQQASQAIAQWRQAHPEATLAEIEAAVDEQMNRLRAHLIEEVTQASPLEQAESEQVSQFAHQVGFRQPLGCNRYIKWWRLGELRVIFMVFHP